MIVLNHIIYVICDRNLIIKSQTIQKLWDKRVKKNYEFFVSRLIIRKEAATGTARLLFVDNVWIQHVLKYEGKQRLL